MITNFKIFENNNNIESDIQFREVDLQLLWDDITKNYYSKIFDKPVHLDIYFLNFLKKLLLNKNVELNRVTNKYYDIEPFYNFKGKVEDIHFKDDNLIKYFILQLDDGNKYSLNFNFGKKSIFIKIYNSNKLDIEKKIDILKDIKKYNL